MVSKFFEKYVKIECGESDNMQQNLELEYYLIESSSDGIYDKEICKTYGVEIVKKQKGSDDESRHFDNIFICRDQTKSLLELLAEHTVTPLTLPYILDDMLGI